MVDKNKAFIDYLLTFPAINENPLFFNYVKGEDDNIQIITSSNDKALDKPYVDGSVLRLYTVTLIIIKSISTNAIVTVEGYTNENVEDIADVQAIIDLLVENAEEHIYPDFGEECLIDDLIVTNSNPELTNIDTSVQPPLAQYNITVQIKYLDNSHVIWE